MHLLLLLLPCLPCTMQRSYSSVQLQPACKWILLGSDVETPALAFATHKDANQTDIL